MQKRHLLVAASIAALVVSVPALAQVIIGGGGGGTGGVAGVSAFNTRNGNVTLVNTDVSAAGGLLAANNLSDVVDPSAALTNLGAIGADNTVTFTHKTISGSVNTLTNIGNSSLTNSSMTIAGHSIALGGTQAIASSDLSDASAVATLTGAQTFTNKAIDFSLNTATKIPLSAFNNLGTTTTVMHGNAAGAPTFSAVNLTNDVVGALALSSIATIADQRILGNVSGSTAAPIALTATQATAFLNVFSSSLKGLAPSSGGGTTNFLRADGTWTTPPGSALSLTCGNGLTCSPSTITGTGSIAQSLTINAKTGNYAVSNTDGGGLVSSTSGTSVADTLVASSTSGYGAGFAFDLYNVGTASTTLTAATSNFDNGLHAIALGLGQDAFVWGDGTNYHATVSLPAIPDQNVIGNVSGNTDYPGALTKTQLTTLVNSFTSSLSGVAPASGGGTTNFLRADGTWAAPSGGAGGLTVGTSTITSGTNTKVLFDNSGVLGEYTITGTGNVVMSASPTLTGTATVAAVTAAGVFSNTQSAASASNATSFIGDSFAGTSSTSSATVYIAGATAATTNRQNAYLWINTDTGCGSSCQVVGVTVNGASAQAFQVFGSGSVTATGTYQSGSGSGFHVATRSQIVSSADGLFTLENNGATDFTRLNFGGNTSSFPSIKKNSTALNIRLADDSADAALTAAGLSLSGTLTFTGTAPTPTGTGSPTIATGSTDSSGEVTAGASATSVVITFATSKTNAPFCTVTSQTQLAAFAYTISTTAITITQTATSGNKIDYVCTQH